MKFWRLLIYRLMLYYSPCSFVVIPIVGGWIEGCNVRVGMNTEA